MKLFAHGQYPHPANHLRMVGSPTRPKKKQKPPRKVITGNPGNVSSVTRTKTGCLTCRQRKKKCDEKKPSCGNCLKANYECEPCPPPKPCPRRLSTSRQGGEHSLGTTQLQWPANSSIVFPMEANHHIADMTNTSLMCGDIAGNTANTANADALPMNRPGFTDGLVTMNTTGYLYDNPVFFSDAPGFAPHPQQAVAVPQAFDDGIETVYTPLGLPQHSQSLREFGSGYFPGGYQFSSQYPNFYNPNFNTGPSLPLAPQSLGFAPIPTLLPSPISGLATEVEKQLFHHFITIMSQVLTISSGERNSMNENIIPLAAEDPVIMKSLLSLSGAHILNQQKANVEQGLKAEKDRLYFQASELQAQRTKSLFDATGEQRREFVPKDHEKLFATALLLCLHGICAGSVDTSCPHHLDMARRILNLITPKEDMRAGQTFSQHQVTPSTVNPFLLEFFLYHDALATVTMRLPETKHVHLHKLAVCSSKDISLVGVNDGLMHFVTRIASFREEAYRRGTMDGVVLIEANNIHQNLTNWQASSEASPDHKFLAELYRIGLSIWLFSITKPKEKSDPQIQRLVRDVLPRMSNLNDNIKACLLFPLFMIGGAAIAPEDKEMVSNLFRQLKEWSSLCNVDATWNVVQCMWREYDTGVPNSWDWMAQLDKLKLSVLVT